MEELSGESKRIHKKMRDSLAKMVHTSPRNKVDIREKLNICGYQLFWGH